MHFDAVNAREGEGDAVKSSGRARLGLMLARGLMADAIGNLLTAAPHTEEWLAASRLTRAPNGRLVALDVRVYELVYTRKA